MLLMGNDYIPKVNFVNINKIIPVYKKLCTDNLVIKKDSYLTLNNKLMSKILFRLLSNNKKFSITKLEQLNFDKIENYLQGLVWCLNDYHNSKTDNMLYMYNYNKIGIHPGELYYYLSLNSNKTISYPLPKCNLCISNKIYPAIVMPYKIKFLVKNNYSDFLLKNHKEIYEEELCETCSELHKQISNLVISRKYLESIDEDTDKIKKNIFQLNNQFTEHKKKTHKRIQYNKYIEIIKELNNFNN
jgi:hypothetical protein